MRWVNQVKKKVRGLWSQSIAAAGRTDSQPPKKWNPRRTLLAIQYLAVGLALVLGLAGWGLAEGRLSRYVSTRYVKAPTAAMVVLRDVPAWVPAAHGAWLRQAVAVQFTRDPLDRQGLERAKLVLAQCPWIETVDRVERHGELVEVTAQYRQPGALVRVGDGYRLIDGHGVLLPGWYQPQRLPIIEGIAVPPPHDGTLWPGSQLQAALVMIRIAAGQPWVSQVRAYDVGHTDALGRTRLLLWTGSGRDPARDPHVVWGLPPGQEASIEPNTANKLARLAAIQKDPRFHGWIDAEHRIVEVYGATMFKREPLPAVSDPAAPTRYTWLR